MVSKPEMGSMWQVRWWAGLGRVSAGHGSWCGRCSGQTPASSLLSSSCLSDLRLRNDVVRIKLWWFNAVTATFTGHILPDVQCWNLRYGQRLRVTSCLPGSSQTSHALCQALAREASWGVQVASAAGKPGNDVTGNSRMEGPRSIGLRGW